MSDASSSSLLRLNKVFLASGQKLWLRELNLPKEPNDLAEILNKLEIIAKIENPFLLGIVGFFLEESGENDIRLGLLYENFREDELRSPQDASHLPLSKSEFLYLLSSISSLLTSGLLLSFLPYPNCFLKSAVLTLKFADFNFLVFSDRFLERTKILEPVKAEILSKLGGTQTPPEIFFSHLKGVRGTITKGSVVWSLGCLLYETAVG